MNSNAIVRLGLLGGLALVIGCSAELGSDDGSVGVQADAIVGDLLPISEEYPNFSRLCGNSPANVGITAANCTGGYCDNITLTCGPLPSGVVLSPFRADTATATDQGYSVTRDAGWTRYISEENSQRGQANQIACESQGIGTGIDGIVDGMRVTGSYADNISLHCRKIIQKPGDLHCRQTGEFSEENGPNTFGAGEFAVGVKCVGSYCDRMSYTVCSFF